MGESDDGWVFDSLVNFLHGPIWTLPVTAFIEDKSVVFDPDSYNNMTDEKESEFKKIHEEYKALVDFMLTSFMDDLQVSPEQVEEACRTREKEGMAQSESHVTKMALEHLWAAEDFNIFRRVMTRKNIDLQLQSLELLVAKYGVLSPALRSMDSNSEGQNGEEDFLQVVIRYSDPSHLFHNIMSRENSDLLQTPEKLVATKKPCHTDPQYLTTLHTKKKATSSSKAIDKSTSTRDTKVTSKMTMKAKKDTNAHASDLALPPLSKIVVHKETSSPSSSQILEQERQAAGLASVLELDENVTIPADQMPSNSKEVKAGNAPKPSKAVKAMNAMARNEKAAVEDITSTAKEHHRILTSVRRALETQVDDSANLASNLALELSEMGIGTDEEIKLRREYLRAQRDKLVAMKKKEREKQLANPEGISNRPKSARAAQAAMQGAPTPGPDLSTDKSLAARRALIG